MKSFEDILGLAREAFEDILEKAGDTIDSIVLDQWKVDKERGQWRIHC